MIQVRYEDVSVKSPNDLARGHLIQRAYNCPVRALVS